MFLRLVAYFIADFPQLLQSRSCRSAHNLFTEFLYFLEQDACKIKMDLNVGEWQNKREGGSLTKWLLFDPCKPRQNAFAGFDQNLVNDVLLNAVLPTLSQI